jgi:hypothetical protein
MTNFGVERAKLERLKRYEEAIESYTRTIELDDATLMPYCE